MDVERRAGLALGVELEAAEVGDRAGREADIQCRGEGGCSRPSVSVTLASVPKATLLPFAALVVLVAAGAEEVTAGADEVAVDGEAAGSEPPHAAAAPMRAMDKVSVRIPRVFMCMTI